MNVKNSTQMKQLNVLIACEESQAETMAFRQIGHHAFSCDIKPCRRGTPPEWHIQGDVLPILDGVTTFATQDGTIHTVDHWDLIIAHPPCTYLCKVSSPLMRPKGILNENRYQQMILARSFFFRCLRANAHYVAVENQLPMALAQLPKPSFFIQPSWFGVKYTKKTLYWVKNLPPLMPTVEYPNPKQFMRSSRGHYRARTFPQVAEAMAKQWSTYIFDELAKQTSPTNST
jgi:hypothetical protein